MLIVPTATTPKLLTRPSQNITDHHLTYVDEMALSNLSGESPETLQFFAERSEQFTEATVLKHFTGITQDK